LGINVTKLDPAWKNLVQKAEGGTTLTHGLLTGRLGIVLLQKPMHGKRVGYFHPTWFGEWPGGSRWPFFKGKFTDIVMKGQTAKEFLKFMDELTNHPNVVFIQAKQAFSDVPELKGKYPIHLWAYPDPLGGAALKQISPEYNTEYVVVVPIRKTGEKMDTGIIKDGGQGVVEYVAPTSVNFTSVRTFSSTVDTVELKPVPVKLPPIIIEDAKPLDEKPRPVITTREQPPTVKVIGTTEEKKKLDAKTTETKTTETQLRPEVIVDDGSLPPVKQTDNESVLKQTDLSQNQLSGKETDGAIKEDSSPKSTAGKFPLSTLVIIAVVFLLGTWFLFRK